MALITQKEAGVILGRSERAIREWVSQGVLKTHLVKQTKYVDSDTVYALKDTEDDISFALQERQKVLEKLNSELENLRKEEGLTKGFICYNVCALVQYIDVLGEREKLILYDVFNGDSFESIGEELGLTRERIRQIFNKALRKFSESLRSYKKLLNEQIELRGLLEQKEAELNEKIKEIAMLRKRLNIEEQAPEEANKKLLYTNVYDLGLSVRAQNCLKAADINTLGELTRMKKTTLMKFRNFGKKTMKELEELVKSYGLEWATDYEER